MTILLKNQDNDHQKPDFQKILKIRPKIANLKFPKIVFILRKSLFSNTILVHFRPKIAFGFSPLHLVLSHCIKFYLFANSCFNA